MSKMFYYKMLCQGVLANVAASPLTLWTNSTGISLAVIRNMRFWVVTAPFSYSIHVVQSGDTAVNGNALELWSIGATGLYRWIIPALGYYCHNESTTIQMLITAGSAYITMYGGIEYAD